MAAAYISPLVIEQGYNWQQSFDITLTNGSARNISGYTAYLTASALKLTGIVSGTIGRISFELAAATTSAYSFNAKGYEMWLVSGATAEKVAGGALVLSTAVWNG